MRSTDPEVSYITALGLPVCDECSRPWLDRHQRWRACRVDLPDDPPAEVFFFCPDCVAAEFGD
jgi:c-di-GMP-binding flagellar brake protein YcgR